MGVTALATPIAAPSRGVRPTYPGDNANATELLALADGYSQAARILLEHRGQSGRAAIAPFRLLAIHAIELYLSALLRASGEDAGALRGRGHDLENRVSRAMELGLVVRKRTLAHIVSLTTSREYLVSRYGSDELDQLSQLNRLAATLVEVGKKVSRLLAQPSKS